VTFWWGDGSLCAIPGNLPLRLSEPISATTRLRERWFVNCGESVCEAEDRALLVPGMGQGSEAA
jgi:hypothetical protein